MSRRRIADRRKNCEVCIRDLDTVNARAEHSRLAKQKHRKESDGERTSEHWFRLLELAKSTIPRMREGMTETAAQSWRGAGN